VTFATCPQSLVDYVVVTYNTAGGPLVDPSLPQIGCLYNGTQGATFLAQPPGFPTYVVTGYQNVTGLGPVAVYRSNPISVATGPYGSNVVLYWMFDRYDANNNPLITYDALTPLCGTQCCTTPSGPSCDVHALGVPDDFDIFANFVNAAGTATIGTYCNAPSVAIDSLTYNLVDHFGTSVASGSMDCGTALQQAGVSFRVANLTGVDLDDYAIRVQGFVTGTATPIFDTATRASVPFFPNCTAQTFRHFGNDAVGFNPWDTSVFDVSANATLCP
jgi:hypothetical protein